jgi:hypothetical protein
VGVAASGAATEKGQWRPGIPNAYRSRLVFEYRDSGESWFDINPILAEAKELQP